MKNKFLFLPLLLTQFWAVAQTNNSGSEISPEYSINLNDFEEVIYTSDVKASVVNRKYEINFVLHAESSSDVFLYVSYDKGVNWTGPLTEVSGDVGYNVTKGQKKIVWDCTKEKGFTSNKNSVKFKVVTSFSDLQIASDAEIICDMMNKMVEAQRSNDTPKIESLQKEYEPKMDKLQSKYPKGSDSEKKLEALVKPCMAEAMKAALGE
jgi:hypothetical protein